MDERHENAADFGLYRSQISVSHQTTAPVQINLRLHRRRAVVRHAAVTTAGAVDSTALRVACLAADHAIR